MSLNPTISQEISISNKRFIQTDFQINLSNDDINIYVNDQLMNIISIQKYFETGLEKSAIESYLVQIKLEDKNLKGKELKVIIQNDSIYGESYLQINY